uniref:Uncharacterized protein n=1 Tax=Neptuniibacter sp. CAR-SF TaxID=197651 RepID=B2DD15_9GAMM|nr:hypothetical protein [Neptuniibacter sp. CAR-SF]
MSEQWYEVADVENFPEDSILRFERKNGPPIAIYRVDDEFFRYVTAYNCRGKCEARVWLTWFDTVIDFTELTRTTRLFLMGIRIFNLFSDCFTVSYLRLTNN